MDIWSMGLMNLIYFLYFDLPKIISQCHQHSDVLITPILKKMVFTTHIKNSGDYTMRHTFLANLQVLSWYLPFSKKHNSYTSYFLSFIFTFMPFGQFFWKCFCQVPLVIHKWAPTLYLFPLSFYFMFCYFINIFISS